MLRIESISILCRKARYREIPLIVEWYDRVIGAVGLTVFPARARVMFPTPPATSTIHVPSKGGGGVDIRCRLPSRRGRRASSQDVSVPLLPADEPKQQDILGQDAVQCRVLDVIRLHPAELCKLVPFEAERERLQEVPFGRGIWSVSEC